MLRTSLAALRAHKLRTSLSVLGIVIGVAAVVAIIAIVNGATAEVKEQIAGLGMRTITVFRPRGGALRLASRSHRVRPWHRGNRW
jgi:ABC-type antimicrobial peptide transport system permease subunit